MRKKSWVKFLTDERRYWRYELNDSGNAIIKGTKAMIAGKSFRAIKGTREWFVGGSKYEHHYVFEQGVYIELERVYRKYVPVGKSHEVEHPEGLPDS